MATIDYEKKYKEALEKARQLCAYPTTNPFISDLQDLFPELAESEGERIRKGLIKQFKALNTIDIWGGLKREDIIAWLENQGEQKPADKAEPKFKVGDVIRLKGSATEYTIKKVTDTTYYTNAWTCGIESCEEDYELVEKKPAWSEEDESLYRQIECTLSICRNKSILSFDLYKEMFDWLKFLKDRYTWKPSDEQMDALDDVISSRDIKYDVLSELWKDLKKLKG